MFRLPAARLVLVLVVCLALPLAACTALPPPSGSGDGSRLILRDYYARPAPAGGNGGAFLTIINDGNTADRLVGVRSDVAPAMELHETIDDNGVMKMRPVNGFDVPAGGTVELKPGGKHIMFIGLTSPLTEGQEIELTLIFENGGEITVKAPIRQ